MSAELLSDREYTGPKFPVCACGHDIYEHGGAVHVERPRNPCGRCDCESFVTIGSGRVTFDRYGQAVFHEHERRRFRVQGSWHDTVTNGPFPLAENIVRREIETQQECHYE
jgi:hypothetical protein